MKNYHTRVKLPSPNGIIDTQDRILTIGSCFAEELGRLLAGSKFEIMVNPLGILFNPVSIAHVVRLALTNESLRDQPNMVLESDGLWHSMYHHGRFSNVDRSALIDDIDAVNRSVNQKIQNVDHVVFTLGSAHAYRLKATGEVVANCHRMHADMFEKILLPVDEIISALEDTILQLRMLNPGMTFFLSVSPVRYIRDGLVESMRTKAALISAVHQVVSLDQNCHYFPAYEIVVDELRDYRFYEEDLVHPNRTAVRYVMDQFMETYFTDGAIAQMVEVERLLKSLQHRPIHRESTGYRDFLVQLEATIRSLQADYAYLDFNKELEAVRIMRSDEN